MDQTSRTWTSTRGRGSNWNKHNDRLLSEAEAKAYKQNLNTWQRNRTVRLEYLQARIFKAGPQAAYVTRKQVETHKGETRETGATCVSNGQDSRWERGY
jgi:hypothetical protein